MVPSLRPGLLIIQITPTSRSGCLGVGGASQMWRWDGSYCPSEESVAARGLAWSSLV